MKVHIKDTAETQTLKLIDSDTGVNYVTDFIGNTGALSDGQFTKHVDSDTYVCDKETFDWWAAVIKDNQMLRDRIDELKEKHGAEAVYKVVIAGNWGSLEDHAANVNQALDDVFGVE